MKRVVIVDDEHMARERVRELLASHDTIQVVGEADRVSDAINIINAVKPDVVFMDIELHDETAFQVIQELSHHPVIIYTTAFNKYALEAFRTSEIAIEYLLKPISQKDMDRAVKKLDSLPNAPDEHLALVDLLEKQLKKEYLEWLNCKLGDYTYMIKVEDIKFIQSKDKYTNLHTIEKKVFPITITITELEKTLDPKKFSRIHRSTIVNRDFIKKGKRGLFGTIELEIEDEDKVLEVSRSYASNFK
ncbi:MAG: response regulator transcription factor [Fibrobacteria bacterium]|nr:response regulator transcription factor [Fibrobacteria bacterium]